MLAVLTGCGLRRAEAAALKVDDLQLREGHWVIADLNGKGSHIRTVPVPDWIKMAIDQWTSPASMLSGTLFRSIRKAGRVGGILRHRRMTEIAPSLRLHRPRATAVL
jgi:integrase